MTTTIPTADLHGILSDVIHFASPDKDDDQRRAVHLRWDGTLLYASATDAIRVAVSSWSPDDKPDKDVQGRLGEELGGGDPFEVLLAHDDVKHLLDTAKPIKNLEYVPLHLDSDGWSLTVRRSKQTRVPGFSLAYDGLSHAYPDLREVVVTAMANAEPVKEIWLNAALMADFGKVRQRGGPAKYTFAGPDRPTVVEIGDRFVGAIQSVRQGGEG